MKRRIAVALGAGILLAGCGGGGDKPARVDCFTASKQTSPTRSEAEEFAKFEIPAEAKGLTTRCEGFQDKYVQVRFVLPRGRLAAFLKAGNFEPGTQLPYREQDDAAFVVRNLSVDARGPREVAVKLDAFQT